MTAPVDLPPAARPRLHCDAYLTAAFLASPLAELLRAVAGLPTVAQVEVFPDIAAKTVGVPTGVVVTTRGPDPMVLPTAVPDVACGFAVIATGIDARAWNAGQARDVFADITTAIGVTSPTRRTPGIDIEQVLAEGAAALGAPDRYLADTALTEQPPRPGHPGLLPADLRRALADHAGSVAGHFVSLYTAHPLPAAAHAGDRATVAEGELVLVVHTGAPAIRAWAYEALFAPIAARCLELGMVDPGLVGTRQLFGLPAGDPLSRAFLKMADTAVCYGYANRQLVADTVLAVLDSHRPARVGWPRLLRHTGHGWYRYDLGRPDAVVRSGRGIQPLTGVQAPSPVTFVTGGERTHAYLFAPGPNAAATGGLIGHGTPMWTPRRIPPHLRRQAGTGTLAALIRSVAAAAARSCTNTVHDRRTWRRDLINLELAAASLEATGLACRVVRLMPWANYKEKHVDAVTRPRS